MKRHIHLFDLKLTPEEAPYIFDAETHFYVKEKRESYIIQFFDLEPLLLEVEQGKSDNIVSINDTIVAHVMDDNQIVHHIELNIYLLLKDD